MHLKFPKNDDKYYWTNHVLRKMAYYGLSGDRVKRVVRNPKRVESGVAENTVAVMQPAGSKKNPYEVWVMYSFSRNGRKSTLSDSASSSLPKGKSGRKIIISAWRYPGVSPIGKEIPIPADILEELKKEGIVNLAA